MKRLLTLTATLLVAAVCWAASPKLASARIFDRKDLRTKVDSFMKSTSGNNRFMNLTARNDKKLLADIREAVEQDRKLATNIVEGYEDGEDYIILNIIQDRGKLSVILNCSADGTLEFSISGPEELFK